MPRPRACLSRMAEAMGLAGETTCTRVRAGQKATTRPARSSCNRTPPHSSKLSNAPAASASRTKKETQRFYGQEGMGQSFGGGLRLEGSLTGGGSRQQTRQRLSTTLNQCSLQTVSPLTNASRRSQRVRHGPDTPTPTHPPRKCLQSLACTAAHHITQMLTYFSSAEQ